MEAQTRLHSLIFCHNHAGWLCGKKRLLALQRFPKFSSRKPFLYHLNTLKREGLSAKVLVNW